MKTIRLSNIWNCSVLIAVLIFVTPSSSAGPSNSLMDISSDGRLLACSNRDSGTVSIVDLATHKKVRELKVGRHPEGVTFLPETHRCAVAVYDEDKVVLIDADSGEIIQSVDVFDEPYGVVSDPSGEHLYVTLDYPGRVLELKAGDMTILRQLDVGEFTRGIAYSANDKRIYTTDYFSSRVRAIDLNQWKVVDEWVGVSTDNICRQIVVHPRRPKAYITHIRSRVSVAQGEGSIFPYVSVIDTEPGEGRRRRRMPMDAFLGNLVTANPWEVALSADGKQFYVVFGGTNDMFACNVVDDDYLEIELRKHLRLGANPRAVCVSPDNKNVYVYEALDFQITVMDSSNLRRVATVDISDNPLDADIHRGKVLFYSALQPMVGRRWISCSSCHPDGQADGRTWQNPEGLRNTQSLAGLAWTHPVHWSADRDEVQDFEHTIRGPLMQGRGLVRGKIQKPLGGPNSGLSSDLDAVAAYTNSHEFTMSPYAKKGLSEQAKRGQTIFLSEETQCASCHNGPYYTDSRPAPVAKIVRHDIGSGKDDPTEKMGRSYDTPTLLGVYRTAPYLHDGSATTLKDVLVKHNKGELHGHTAHLDEKQIDDLVEFLKSLPFESPLPAAKNEDLKRVRK